jgi:hypothetical protein
MTRLEKCELLKSKGFTYNPETGKIFGVRGKEIIRKNKNGYIIIDINYQNKKYNIYGHHYAWYWVYGNVDFEMLDHINRDRSDNRISNLRITNHIENQQNQDGKGYGFHKRDKKWFAQIWFENKKKWLGYFDTEEEARQAYLSAKLKYHPGFTHLNQ